MKIALDAIGSARKGIPYSTSERNLFAALVTTVLVAAEVNVPKPTTVGGVDALVSEAMTELAKNNTGDLGAAAVIRTAYRIAQKDPANKFDLPKLRDPTSIRLLTREALATVGCGELADQVAPKYGATA